MSKKPVIILIVISLLVASLALPVSGLNIRIDGVAVEKAWLDCHTQVLVSNRDESNNDVGFAIANVLYDEDNNRAYLSFKVNVNGLLFPSSQDTDNTVQYMHGVRINVDNSGFIGVSHSGTEPYDENLYFIEAAVSEHDSSAFSAEICLGVKLGLHTLDSVSVQFIDGNGIPSNVYELDLPLLPSEETTIAYQPDFNETEKETTTRNNTTRITTTRRVTTERTTRPEKTTVQKTTAVKTTKEKTTKIRTTKPKTTAKVVTVYVTVPQMVETTANATTGTETASEQVQQERTYKELKYAAAAGLLILIFGLCVIINMLNDKNKSDRR